MAKTKVHGEYLDPSVISGQTQVTAVGADSVLILDATDNALKKALLSDVIETVGSTPSFTSATISGSNPVLNIARTSNYSYKIGSLANDTFVIQSNETSNASYAPLIEIDSYAHQGTIFLKGDANGRLGLLESSPDAPLHITATGAASQGTIKLQGTSSHIGFHQANDTFKTWIGHYNTANHGSNTDFNIKAGYNGGGNIRITADGDTTQAQMYIEGSTGRVGIGTPASSLSHGLVVSDENTGSAANRRVTIKSVTHGQNAGFRFDAESADGTNKSGGLYFQPNNGNGSYIGLTGNDANDHLLIDANGYTTFVHTGGTDFGMQIRTSSTNNSARSGIVFDKPGTSTIMGSALLLRSDESYRLGTASNYHMIMNQNGTNILGNSGNLSPNSTAFKNSISGSGTSGRVLYLQSGTDGTAASVWWGGANTPQAAFDAISSGGAQIWSHESNSWSQITEYKHAYFKSLKDTYIGGNTWINGTGNYNNYNENIRLAYPANGVCVIAWGDTGGINSVSNGGTPRHSQLYFNSANSFRHRNDNGTAIYTLSSGGAASFVGSVTQNTSDERLKENVEVIPNALTKVKGIRGVTFDWKDKTPDSKELDVPSSGHDVGVLAQEVQAVLPEAVQLAPFDTSGPDYLEEDVDYGIEEGTSITGEDYLTVDYEKLVPLLIEAIKELETRVKELEGE